MKERVYFPNYVENDISSWVLSPDKEAIESLYHPCPVTGRDSVSLFESSIMIADRILNEGVPYAFCATAIKYLIQAILKGVLDPHHPTTLIKYSDPINPDIPNLSWRIYQNELQQFTISRWGKGIYRDEELQPIPLKTETPIIEKPLHTTERKTLLIIIEALSRHANIDTSHHESAGVTIQSLTDDISCHVAAGTIARHLKLIPDAIKDRRR